MTTLPFPDLAPIEDANAVLLAVNGALGILAAQLEGFSDIGTDMPHAAYAAGCAIEHAQHLLNSGINALVAFRTQA